jgi:hypothetical protein
MSWRSRSKRKEIFYCIGYILREAKSAMVREVPLPGGEVLRVMDKALHITALESAGRKLRSYVTSPARESLAYEQRSNSVSECGARPA